MKNIGKTFSNMGIDNLIVKFPGIKVQEKIDDQPRKVNDFHYCASNTKIRKNPVLIGMSKNVIQMLGFDYQAVIDDENTSLYLSGSKKIDGSANVCHNYCGYQFGVWAGQLGDGRAHTLGTVKNKGKVYELQLKGSGLSPFSRHADGNSVVSSAVRQFLASELMAGLKVPTTRAASIVFADQAVKRDPFYDGNIKIQKPAIVLRVAPTFLRIGSFQVCNKNAQMDTGNPLTNRKILEPLAKYLNKYVYPEFYEEQCDIYQEIYKEVVNKNAKLVAHWRANGFVHGVLNTDNISMAGVTIDYGPFGFMDYFSKDYLSNATDQYQRYSYRHQPDTMKFNLLKLAESFDCLIPKSILKRYLEQNFDKIYMETYDELISKKLGLSNTKQNQSLIQQLFEIMHICRSNFINTFRILNDSSKKQFEELIQSLLSQSLPTFYYLKNLRAFNQLKNIKEPQVQEMKVQDPGFNCEFILQQKQRIQLQNILKTESCEERTERQKQLWSNWLKKYLQASIDLEVRDKNTVRYILLNQTAKNITEDLVKLQKPVEQNNLINKVLAVFEKPYEINEWFEQKYWSKRPIPIRLTCSS